MQEIAKFLRRTDDYQLDPDVEAFLLRGVKAYYRQNDLEVCDDLNQMVFLDNPQYPNGCMPNGKMDVVSHIQSAFLYFALVMDGT